jgi:hypothetical protein
MNTAKPPAAERFLALFLKNLAFYSGKTANSSARFIVRLDERSCAKIWMTK